MTPDPSIWDLFWDSGLDLKKGLRSPGLVPEVRQVLREHLARVTACAHVLKITHGGIDDARWLLRDFGARLALLVRNV